MPPIVKCVILPFFVLPFLLGGALLILLAASALVDALDFARKSTSAQGTVITMQQSQKLIEQEGFPAREATMYRPVIRFQGVDGAPIEFASSFASSSPRYVVGDKVDVLYVPGDSSRAEISSFFRQWGPSMTLAAIGVFLCLFSGFAYWLCSRLWSRWFGQRRQIER